MEHGGCDPTAWVGVTQRELILSARFVLERCLHDWVWQQNCVKGVAPSRNQLMEEGAKLLPATVPEPGACKDLSPNSVSICCQNAAEVVGQLSLSLGCSHRSLENPGACTAIHVMQCRARHMNGDPSHSPGSFCSESSS